MKMVIIHYNATKTNKKLSGLFATLDSGGQYKYGTTDVTRTILVGKANEEMKRLCTLF